MLFRVLQERLVAQLRSRVRAGEVTERGLARLTGFSQPHIHHVLKGARALSLESADRIMEQMAIPLRDLLTAGELGAELRQQPPSVTHVPWLSGEAGPFSELGEEFQEKDSFPLPAPWIQPLVSPVMVTLAQDPRLYPHFQDGDFALVDRAVTSPDSLRLTSVYLVRLGKSTLLRSVRVGGSRLYLLTPDVSGEPRLWEYVPLTGQDLTTLIMGRVVWLNRMFP